MKAQYNPSDILLLLGVFKKGLSIGLISKEEIIAWADDIILKGGSTPDYYLIEISLSGNVNKLSEVLYQYSNSDEDLIFIRVLFGVLYHRLIDDSLGVEDIAHFIGKLNDYYSLTNFESNKAFLFEDHEMYLPDVTLFQVDIIKFLSIYKDFQLEDPDEWAAINSQVAEVIKREEYAEEVINEEFRRKWALTEKKRRLKRKVFIGLSALVIFCVIVFIVRTLPVISSEFNFTPLITIGLSLTLAWARNRYLSEGKA